MVKYYGKTNSMHHYGESWGLYEDLKMEKVLEEPKTSLVQSCLFSIGVDYMSCSFE